MPHLEVNKVASLEGHTDCVYSLAASHRDTEIISAAGDGMVVVWDLTNPKDGELVVKVPNSVYSTYLYDESNTLIVGQNFEGIHEIDLSTKKEIRSLQLTDKEIFAINAIDNNLLVATKNGEIIIVDYATFTIKKRLRLSDKSARCIAIGLHDFAVGYSDNSIRIIDKFSFELKHTLREHTISVFGLSYAPDLKTLVSVSRDALIKIWDSEKNYALITSINAHMYAINDIVFTNNGNHFITCSMDKSVKIWDASSYKLIKVIDKSRFAGHGNSINKLFWSTKMQQLISASDDRTLSVWDIKIK